MHSFVWPRLARIAVVIAVAGFGLASVAPREAAAQDVKQIKLTEPQVLNFIAARPDMTAVAAKINAGKSGKPDPKIVAALEDTAKKHGFASFAEFDEVAGNIMLVLAGIDPEKKTFTDPVTLVQTEIEAVKADTNLKKAEKDSMLKELNEALASTRPVQFQDNVALVQKHFDKLKFDDDEAAAPPPADKPAKGGGRKK